MRTKPKAVAVLVTAFCLPLAPRVNAHEETAVHALSVLHDVTPQISGLEIRVVQLTFPALVARNTTNESLVVLGQDGEPFLRIANGRVETNLRSPTTYRASNPMSPNAVPKTAVPGAPPQWHLVGRRHQWSWFDPRIRYSDDGARNWQVTALLGGQPVVISGGFERLEGHGHFTTIVDHAPQIPALEIKLLDGLVPAIYVRNDTRRVLEVAAPTGEPLLQIGPNGVFANTNSPSYYLAATQSVRAVPEGVDPGAPPHWKKLSVQPIWSWLEYRARLPAESEQRTMLGDERRSVLDWVTPMKLGQQQIELAGHVEWVPPRVESDTSESRFGFVEVALLSTGIAGAVAAALFTLRRRVLR